MKAVILAAGFGTGIGSLTKLTPKPLIPIANRPIIEHLIRTFLKMNIFEIKIIVGHLGNQIVEYFKNFENNSLDLQIVYSKNYAKGPIYSFYDSKSLDIEEDFILTPADLYLSQNIISNLVQHHKKGTITIAVDSSKLTDRGTKVFTIGSRHNSQNKKLKYGRVSGFGSRVLNKSDGSAISIPLVICSPTIFNFVEMAIEQNKTQVISALNIYIKKSKPLNFLDIYGEYWVDIDNLHDILTVNRYTINNNIKPKNHFLLTKNEKTNTISKFIHPTTEIIPPILIGEDCYINRDSRIGPYVSLNDNTLLESNSVITNSIIYGNSHLPENSKVKDAIIYKNKKY